MRRRESGDGAARRFGYHQSVGGPERDGVGIGRASKPVRLQGTAHVPPPHTGVGLEVEAGETDVVLVGDGGQVGGRNRFDPDEVRLAIDGDLQLT